jgi:hypothetical protein
MRLGILHGHTEKRATWTAAESADGPNGVILLAIKFQPFRVRSRPEKRCPLVKKYGHRPNGREKFRYPCELTLREARIGRIGSWGGGT